VGTGAVAGLIRILRSAPQEPVELREKLGEIVKGTGIEIALL
jgi:hypothetical protein